MLPLTANKTILVKSSEGTLNIFTIGFILPDN